MRDLEVKMNFEHLFDKKRKKTFCKATQNEYCYWVPTGNIRSMMGNNVNVTLYCKNCSRREDIFLTAEQFIKQENLINTEMQKEVSHVSARE
tara:strand:+ start:73 stop:348 length:276 start_codon:yes stop_codon:yes gene_type:complete